MPYQNTDKKRIRIYGRLSAPDVQPHLLSLRLESYRWFLEEGIEAALRRASPIETDMPWRLSISLSNAELAEPEHEPLDCWRHGVTYQSALTATARLTDLETGEIKEQKVRLGNIPLMTDDGSFVIGGVKRVVIHQIIRSPGAYMSAEYEPLSGRLLGRARIIPARGLWLNFETNANDILKARLDAGGKAISAIAILRVFGLETDKQLLDAFEDVDTNLQRSYILNSLLAHECDTIEDAYEQVFAQVAPGMFADFNTKVDVVKQRFFDRRRYDLSEVGRHMLNRRFGVQETGSILSTEDVVRVVGQMMRVSNAEAEVDDVDHLANRRVRAPGETVFNVFEQALYETSSNSVRRMQGLASKPERPLDALIFTKVNQVLGKFFSGSKLCQVIDDTNPIAELTHKRRVTSLGPGGLTRENAGVEPRDVHHTHYGKLCPIETPEGQNIGLLCTLTLTAQIDKHGLLTSPVRRVERTVDTHDENLIGRTVWPEDFELDETRLLAGEIVSAEVFDVLQGLPSETIGVRAYVRNDPKGVHYLNAEEERTSVIAQATEEFDALGQFRDESISARRGHNWVMVSPENAEYVDLMPRQVISASSSLIPFLEHNDANRALMGCNMQRQAVPLFKPQPSLVTTGSERLIAADSGYQVQAEEDGVVTSVSADSIRLLTDDGSHERVYDLRRMERANQFTCIEQRPLARKFQIVKAGDLLADAHACREGELALGQRVLVAYMSWGGYNYEDAIILSSRVAQEGKFRSRHLKKFKIEARDIAGVGAEHITRQLEGAVDDDGIVPYRLRNLDEDGIVRVGSFVKPGDVLVGLLRPRLNPVERRNTPYDKLVQEIFGVEPEIRYIDKSLVTPKGQEGRVVSVKVIRRGDGSPEARAFDETCEARVEIEIATTRDVQPGDKMSGRHGNKGCVSIVVPQEDMPFLEDGTPVDVILSPLGVPSRMNLGQLMEVHLGWAAHRLGFRAITRAFDSASWHEVEQTLAQAWLVERAGGLTRSRLPQDDSWEPDWTAVRRWCKWNGHEFTELFTQDAAQGVAPGVLCLQMWMRENGYDATPYGEDYEKLRAQAVHLDRQIGDPAPIMGKQWLRDGRTGERLDMAVMVGYKYMLKLVHMVADKAHARSTGSYSSITQQPLGGKANKGGQRLGEMEVWALEAYSGAHNLREMLTIKSDDVQARNAMTRAIMEDVPGVRGMATKIRSNLPDSFMLLIKEIQSMGLRVELLKDGQPIPIDESEYGGSEDDGDGPTALEELLALMETEEAEALGKGDSSPEESISEFTMLDALTEMGYMKVASPSELGGVPGDSVDVATPSVSDKGPSHKEKISDEPYDDRLNKYLGWIYSRDRYS